MPLKRILIVTTAGVLTLAAALPALAESNDDERNGREEIDVAATATVTLSQAISTAESSSGGRAVRAGYESQDGTPVIQVNLVKDRAVLETRIDPGTGKVIATTNRDEREHEEDEEG